MNTPLDFAPAPVMVWREAVIHTHLGHIQFNVRAANLPFYKDLMTFLGWQTLSDEHEMLGLGGEGNQSVWFVGQVKDVSNDYDGPGMDHLAFGAASITDIDATASYLRAQGVRLLFETPRHRPEFAGGEDQTYYQVMFESPDRILLEIVYTGPHGA